MKKIDKLNNHISPIIRYFLLSDLVNRFGCPGCPGVEIADDEDVLELRAGDELQAPAN